MRAAVLDGIAGLVKALNAFVEGDHFGDFVADGLRGLAAEEARAFGVSRGGEFEQDFPFGFRFANFARNFRTEYDATLGDRLGAAAILLVTGFSRQERHFFLWLEKHLIRENNVLMHAQR